MNKELLLEYLKQNCHGRKNTRKSVVIERALNIRRKELQKLVNRMRQEGIPIGSSKDGYFYAETAGEVYSTIRQLRDMQNGLEKAIKGLERGLDSFGFHEGGGSAW